MRGLFLWPAVCKCEVLVHLKCIVVCSGKGGTGKSCVAAYTSVALASAGKRVLLIELAGNTRSIEIILGVREAAFGALDIFAGQCKVGDAILEVENVHGLFFLPAGDGPPPEDERPMRRLLNSVAEYYDFVVIDGGQLYCLPVTLCNMFLMVTTPDTLSVRACSVLSRQLTQAGAREVRLIINNIPPRIIPIAGAQDFDDVIDIIGARLIALIPASPCLAYCSNNAQPLDPDSLTIKEFGCLAGRLVGKRIPLLIR